MEQISEFARLRASADTSIILSPIAAHASEFLEALTHLISTTIVA